MMSKELALSIDKIVDDSSGQFVSTLTQYKWDLLPDSQLAAAKQALSKNDYILGVAARHPEYVHNALVQAAVLGLDLTEGKRQGWLLPRKTQQKDANGKDITGIHLQVGYKGVEAIHQRMGVIDRLVIRVVHENDVFDWSGDDAEKPKHEAKPNWFATDEERGPISGAFAITYYPDGSTNTVTKSISEIHKNHRDRSDSWKSYQKKVAEGKWAYPPTWQSDEKAMIEKTMAFVAAKQWPANIRDGERSSKILETLHETDVADYTWKYTIEQKNAFYDFFNREDELGMFLFSKRVDIETYAALYNTFPKGHKVKNKAKVNELANVGAEIMQDIHAAIDSRDTGKLAESVEDSAEITMKMLNAALSDAEKIVFLEMMAEIE